MSAEARRRISAAVKARWAKQKSAKPGVVHREASKPKRRTMSTEARAKIAAAQRKRWAKVKRAKS
jgi:hypothetical protein